MNSQLEAGVSFGGRLLAVTGKSDFKAKTIFEAYKARSYYRSNFSILTINPIIVTENLLYP